MAGFPYEELPVVTTAEAAHATALARWAPWWRVDAGARTALARVGVGDGRLEVGPALAPRDWTGEALRLEGVTGLAAAVALDAAFTIRVVARFLGDPDPEVAAPRALSPGERGVVRYLAAAALDALGASWITGEVVPAEAALRALGPGAVGFDVMATGAGVRGRLRLAVAASTLAARPAPDTLTPAARLRLALLPVQLRALAGVAVLSRDELGALAPGDVVVLDSSRAGLAAGAALLPARLTPPATGARELVLTLTSSERVPQEVHRLMSAPKAPDSSSLTTPGKNPGKTPLATPGGTPTAVASGATPAGGDDARAASLLGELPVELTAELGRITLTARAALELAPGAVVRLGRPPGPIELTAQGTTIARGELVLVDGELGIRITQLG